MYSACLLYAGHEIYQEERISHELDLDYQGLAEVQVIRIDVNRLFFFSFQAYNHTKLIVGIGPFCAISHLRSAFPPSLGSIKRLDALSDSV